MRSKEQLNYELMKQKCWSVQNYMEASVASQKLQIQICYRHPTFDIFGHHRKYYSIIKGMAVFDDKKILMLY
jgi:hypothetical protein